MSLWSLGASDRPRSLRWVEGPVKNLRSAVEADLGLVVEGGAGPLSSFGCPSGLFDAPRGPDLRGVVEADLGLVVEGGRVHARQKALQIGQLAQHRVRFVCEEGRGKKRHPDLGFRAGLSGRIAGCAGTQTPQEEGQEEGQEGQEEDPAGRRPRTCLPIAGRKHTHKRTTIQTCTHRTAGDAAASFSTY